MRLFIYLFIISSLLASCNVERRLHNPGWHVEWKHRNNVVTKAPTADTILLSQETPKKTIPETTVPTSLQVTDSETPSGIRTEEMTPEQTETTPTDFPEDQASALSVTQAANRTLTVEKTEPQSDNDELKPSKRMKWKELDGPVRSIWVMNLIYGIVLLLLFVILLATSNVIIEGITSIVFFLYPFVLLTTYILAHVATKRKKLYPERYDELTIQRAVNGGLRLSLLAIGIISIIGIFYILATAESHG